ncbi:helix-turn-helix domain-containing protein [Reyranella sp. CPCC 100927]|uniref:helix-turn-helix domain-containing protein n=1 Tax=Reyranella sp. CPCC 100927 TaxID=2599616 RepID=UPI0011B7F690|nr:AraC family transcriptional regulator [Reyranella sp. CPCC 100927]TWT10162.1 helix-turn-helix transcriptional regulator [Reyranella sp. CPCC 100927]
MESSTPLPVPLRPGDYHAVAERFGYRYRRIVSAPQACEANDDCVLSAGLLDIDEVQPGLVITRSDVVQIHDVNAEAEMMPGLMVGVVLAGRSEGWLDGSGLVSVQSGQALAMRIDRPLTFNGNTPLPGMRQRMFFVFARPEWLAIHDLHDRPPPNMQAGASLKQWMPSLRLGSLVEEAMRADRADPLKRLRQEAVALELLAEAIRQFTPALTRDSGLRPHEHMRMQRVRERLMAAPEADYTLASLARDAGVSTSVLKDHFQRAFGQSVFECLRHLRLDRARQGLLDEGWTVAQAAYHAGYRHPTNFATAFRRRFGAAPNTIRR